jgi:hypothetical protein
MENYNRTEKDIYGTYYYLNSKLHRIDGPAIDVSLYKEWWQNGLRHRLNGPAYENIYGEKQWYYEGKRIDCKSQEEFERIIKLKLFW